MRPRRDSRYLFAREIIRENYLADLSGVVSGPAWLEENMADRLNIQDSVLSVAVLSVA